MEDACWRAVDSNNEVVFTSAPFSSKSQTTSDGQFRRAANSNGVKPLKLSLTLPGLASTHCRSYASVMR